MDNNTEANTQNNPIQMNITPPAQKNLKDMSPEEQVNHWKTAFQKSKKLITIYEDKLKQLELQNKTVKDKLKNYEEGILSYINL